jgi:hypothetical protein
MPTITVTVQGLGEFDGTFAYPVGTPYIPLLRFVGEQAGGAAPWRTLAQAVAVLALTGAQQYVLDWAKRAVRESAAQLVVPVQPAKGKASR